MALTPADVVGSLFRWRQIALGQLSRMLDNAIAVGQDAIEVAGRFRDYASPLFAPRRDARGVLRTPEVVGAWPGRPGAASAGARRLLGMTVRISQHEAAIEVAGGQGMGVFWSVGHHGNDEVCEDYGEQDNGFGPGIYTQDSVPDVPHPNCQCFSILVPLVAGGGAA